MHGDLRKCSIILRFIIAYTRDENRIDLRLYVWQYANQTKKAKCKNAKVEFMLNPIPVNPNVGWVDCSINFSDSYFPMKKGSGGLKSKSQYF